MLTFSTSLAALLLLLFLLTRYARNPLRAIPPAHPLCHFTPLWILTHRWRATETAALRAAHERLGPVVCLGPREVSVNCVRGGLRVVYGAGGGFAKAERGDVGDEGANWYAFFANYRGVPNMFSMGGNKVHAHRKRMLRSVYAKAFVMGNEALLAQVASILYDRFLPRLKDTFSQLDPGVLDIYALLSGAAVDIVTGYIFGLKAGSNLLEDPPQLAWFLDLYHSRRPFSFWAQELPTFTAFVEMWSGLRMTPKWVGEANSEIEKWTADMCDAAEEVVKKGMARLEHLPVVYQHISNALAQDTTKEASSLKEMVASEVLDHLAAGFDTSSITLVYVVHQLSKNKAIQTRLQKELLALATPIIPSSSPLLPDPKVMDALPLLHAILWETLRLHPAIPGPQPRFTPPQGCHLGPDATYFVPGGVRVSASAGILHRNEDVYECADEWKPDRWLQLKTLNAETRKDMETRWFWAFGSGARMCIGSHLAVYQMKYLVAALYSNYTTSIVDDADIEQSDAYTAPPKSGKLLIKLTRLEEVM